MIASDIWRRVPWPARALMKRRMDSPEQGARTSLYCATSPELADESGRYYDECAAKQPGAAVSGHREPGGGAVAAERRLGRSG